VNAVRGKGPHPRVNRAVKKRTCKFVKGTIAPSRRKKERKPILYQKGNSSDSMKLYRPVAAEKKKRSAGARKGD